MFASGLSFAVNEFPFTSHNFSTRMVLRDEEAREMDISNYFFTTNFFGVEFSSKMSRENDKTSVTSNKRILFFCCGLLLRKINVHMA